MSSTMPWWANSVLGAALALLVAWIAISFDRRKTVNQELIKKRLSIYDEMAPKLNDILCFFSFIGRFRSLPPGTIIAHKRELDRTIHVYGPIFSPALRDRYDEFVKLCFIAFAGGVGRPALIAADVVRSRRSGARRQGAGRGVGRRRPRPISTAFAGATARDAPITRSRSALPGAGRPAAEFRRFSFAPAKARHGQKIPLRALLLAACGQSTPNSADAAQPSPPRNAQTALFAGGCFCRRSATSRRWPV